ncbi:MAG: isocitrate lyase/phosphoenolpyruvate mutase family protein [Thaumarchaeota archaeon]|nr:isocitrate lyase/phosphoenolpyruvate mutase family protein [Nitrososphaerota archaeon]
MFKDQLDSGRMLIFSGIWDTLSARIVEHAGFDGIWIGSMTTTSSLNAAMDIGLRSMREQVELVHKIRGVTKLPIVVDGEQGGGESVQAAYWVREFERAGAEGIMFEDNLATLGSIYIEGSKSELEPLERAVAKIRAAVDARSNSNFQIIARSSAQSVSGMEEQIKRLKAYKKAGADIIWATSNSADTLRTYRKNIEGPLWTTINPAHAEQAKMSIGEFRGCGIQVLCFESFLFLASVKASMETAKELRNKGSVVPLKDKIMDLKQFLDFMGYTKVNAFVKKYESMDI